MLPPGILERIGRTPLVPLTRIGAGLAVPVLAKCEHLNPGGSVKDRLALAIVDDAEARGALAPGATLVEATAGNTGVGRRRSARLSGPSRCSRMAGTGTQPWMQALGRDATTTSGSIGAWPSPPPPG